MILENYKMIQSYVFSKDIHATKNTGFYKEHEIIHETITEKSKTEGVFYLKSKPDPTFSSLVELINFHKL
jgi:hypothetical protein